MKSYFRILIIICFPIFIADLLSQQINSNIVLDLTNLEYKQSDKIYFSSFKNDIKSFINNRSWIKDSYKNHERINVTFVFGIIKRVSEDKFITNIQIKYTRPIYNSIYNTTVLDIKDNNVNFEYVEGQKIDFEYNTFSSNLSSVMAYYVYLILGIDYDSFSLKGGEDFLKIANTIVSIAQNRGYAGWSYNNIGVNRYWIINRLVDKSFSKFRDVIYKYHIKGIDLIIDNPIQAQKNILESFEDLKSIAQDENNKVLTKIFFDVKSDEIVDIFHNASDKIKNKSKKILSQIYSSYQYKWDEI